MLAFWSAGSGREHTGDAERREQGRRSGNERWQQALKILLVDAAAMHLPRLGLNFLSTRLPPIQMRASLYAALAWKPRRDPARVQIQQQ